jgi:hypothetical protein
MMKNKALFIGFLGVLLIARAFAGGSAEGSGSNRGTFLTRGGYIIPPEDVKIESYISQNDYNYPLPDQGELRVITGAGTKDDNLYILMGLKGRKTPFAELPPLNITFCIDRSGSMTFAMPWVKDCFYIFIDQVREGDYISLVDMNTNAQVLIPTTQIKNDADRTRFKRSVDRIVADGGTDVYAGMLQSYKENEKNYNTEYVNRVVILTDGMHNFGDMINKDILDLAANYNQKGISISTVMLGVAAATGLMTDVAIKGGGSSRFISDHDEMVKIFQTELDRMLVPVAQQIKMRLVPTAGITFKETWGYENYREGDTIHYYLPTLHNGDYETMFAELSFKALPADGIVGVFHIDFMNLQSSAKTLGPYTISLSIQDNNELLGDIRVREAEGYLYFARGLIDIANKSKKIGELQRDLQQYRDPSPQRKDVVEQIKLELRQNLDIIGHLTDYLLTISESLGGDKYEKELEILQNYTKTFTEVYSNYGNTE